MGVIRASERAVGVYDRPEGRDPKPPGPRPRTAAVPPPAVEGEARRGSASGSIFSTGHTPFPLKGTWTSESERPDHRESGDNHGMSWESLMTRHDQVHEQKKHDYNQ